MTYAQDIAILNLNAGAANLATEILRRVIDRDARAEAVALLAKLLDVAIAGTAVKDKPKRVIA